MATMKWFPDGSLELYEVQVDPKMSTNISQKINEHAIS